MCVCLCITYTCIQMYYVCIKQTSKPFFYFCSQLFIENTSKSLKVKIVSKQFCLFPSAYYWCCFFSARYEVNNTRFSLIFSALVSKYICFCTRIIDFAIALRTESFNFYSKSSQQSSVQVCSTNTNTNTSLI